MGISNEKQFTDLLEDAMTGRLTRREVLRRAVVLGLSIPAIGALLAACGGDDDDDDETPEAGATTPAGAGSPTTAATTAATAEGTAEGTPEGTAEGTAEATAEATAEGTAEGTAEATAEGTSTGEEPSIENPPPVANAEEASAFSGAQITYYGDGVGIGNDLDLALAGAFTEATGIEVEVIPRPESATETYAAYQRAFQSQSGDIDVMMLDIVWPGAFAAHLTDLTETFSDVMDQWFPAVVQNNTVDDKFVGAPWFGDFGILYYRTDLLEEYGFDGPPTTWDELEEMAQTIIEGEAADNPEFVGFVFQGNAYEGLTCDGLEWIASAGGGNIIEEGEVTLDNENAIAMLTKVQGWVGTIAPTGVTSYTEEESRNVFQSGNAAFMRNWPYAYSLGNADDSPINGLFDVAPLPANEGQEPVGTLGGWQLAVSAYSENQEASIEFVKYMVGAEVVKWRATVATFVPLITSVAEDPEVLANQPYLTNLADVVRVTRPSRETGENYNQVSTEFFQGVNEILNGADAADVVPEMAQRIERLLG